MHSRQHRKMVRRVGAMKARKPNGEKRRAARSHFVKPGNHCFSMYIQEDDWWRLQLAEKLANKTKRSSVSALLNDLLDLALKDYGMMDRKGNSLVKGIGPEPKQGKKKRIVRGTITLD